MTDFAETISSESVKPLVVRDGDCDFCALWVEHWRTLTGDSVDYTTFQDSADEFEHIPRENFERAIHLFLPDGETYTGAAAVFRLLKDTPRRGWMWWLYRYLPGFALITEFFYGIIARHRNAAYRLTKFLWGDHIGPNSYALTRWLFLRALGIIYLIAFASYAVQFLGLNGSKGILPVGPFLGRVLANPNLPTAFDRYRALPTLAWLDSSDPFMLLMAWGGVIIAVLLILDFANLPALAALYVLYLSLMKAGQTFYSFQWDTLLLEVGFLAIFLAPPNLLPNFSNPRQPPIPVIWLFRWLLFRLMLGSGLVKLGSGDPVWSNLTALDFHYESQPIPTPLSWYFHHLPDWLNRLSTLLMFVIEIGLPFLIWTPRRIRLIAFGGFVMLQLLILLTGNYTFFNWLTLALCILLLDDDHLRRFVPSALRGLTEWRPPRRTIIGRGIRLVVAVLLMIVSTVQFSARTFRTVTIPQPAADIANWFGPFHIANSYGLFAVMTRGRPEIEVQGSDDGENWRVYEFKYKIEALDEMPPFVAPYQPRLDWQMWFAALSSFERTAWFGNMMTRLLQGSPDVLALLEHNPFPTDPPRFVRAVMYEYRFATPEEHALTGVWWAREEVGLWSPVLNLSE